MLGVGMRAGLLDTALMVSVCVSFDAPGLMPVSGTFCAGASWPRIRSLIGSRVGGSLTELTVRTNGTLALAPLPSVTVTVMVVVPKRFVAGRTARLRLAPGPLKTRLALGTRFGSDEVAVSVRADGSVSGSLTASGRYRGTSSSVV